LMQMTLAQEGANLGSPREFPASKRRKGLITPQHRYDGVYTWKLGHGSSRCVCTKCGDGFNSVAAFDKHQVLTDGGDVLCRDPTALGMARLEDGWWVTSLDPRKHGKRRKEGWEAHGE
jgi:hypothetical protein